MDTPKKEGEKAPKEQQPQEEQPLSNDFFAQLLHLPTCKTKGYCSNCGRCEH